MGSGQLAFHPRNICCIVQPVPQPQLSFLCPVTKLMQSLCQGNNVLPSLVISTHNTLDMPVVLRGIHEDLLVTELSCNWLSLSLGDKPHLWFCHYLGCNHQESGFSIAVIGHRCLIRVYYCMRVHCKQGLQNSRSGASLFVTE